MSSKLNFENIYVTIIIENTIVGGCMEIVSNNLRLIVMDNFWEFGKKVDGHLKLMRGVFDDKASFIVPTTLPRFSSGEAKAIIEESIRAKDVYILSDVTNYDCTYKMHGFINHKSPDDHYQDIKRVISAMNGAAESVKVIMPFLYESRQHKRKNRESTDCSLMLHELEFLGVKGIITCDAHDPGVRNALHNCSFDNVYLTHSILNQFIDNENIDYSNLIIVAPDTGASDRAEYYANILGSNIGQFTKRRDYTRIVNGKNPILAHEYIGTDVKDKTAIVVDDMISSGQSMLEVAEKLKNLGANKVYLIASFSLLSDGLDSVKLFQDAYEKKFFDKLYTTNLSYVPYETKSLEWFQEVDCSLQITQIISALNNHQSISPLLNGKEKMLEKVKYAKQKQGI